MMQNHKLIMEFLQTQGLTEMPLAHKVQWYVGCILVLQKQKKETK